MISMTCGGYAQPTRFLGGSDHSPVNSVTSPVVIRYPPKENYNLICRCDDKFFEGKAWFALRRPDGGNGSFDKGGLASHRKVLDSILFCLYDTMYLCL